MPLKGINLGPGSTDTHLNTDHCERDGAHAVPARRPCSVDAPPTRASAGWFLPWEQKGDFPLRYFIEPVVLTANYAEAAGYAEINMAGLSGGGWSTTFAPAVDKRIKRSFPIAGSVPCAMRNPTGKMPNQTWTGSDAEDYEQSCMPPDAPQRGGDDNPGRHAFVSCNCAPRLLPVRPRRAAAFWLVRGPT
jgi:hypothetical protein